MGSACCKGEDKQDNQESNVSRQNDSMLELPVDGVIIRQKPKRVAASRNQKPNAGMNKEPEKSTGVAGLSGSMIVIVDEASLIRGVNQFAFDVYRQLAQTMKTMSFENRRNIVFSPLILASGVAVIESGAEGVTREQIRRLFGSTILSAGTFDLGGMLGSLSKKVSNNVVDGEFRTANGLFYDETIELRNDFVQRATNAIGARVDKCQFRKRPDQARSLVNQFVKDATLDKIAGVFEKLHHRRRVTSVLVNAVYMQMPWAYPFDEKSTHKGQFYRIGDADPKQAHFMHRIGEFGYFEPDESLQLLELPYADRSMSMFVVLPKERKHVPVLDRYLNPDNLTALIESTSTRLVDVRLPRFSLRLQMDMKDVLAKLGWHNWRNLGRTSMYPQFEIDEAVHETYIKVTEKGPKMTSKNGTGAGSHSGSSDQSTSSAPGAVQFKADHPFMFLVVHKPSKLVVFMGRVESVEEW